MKLYELQIEKDWRIPVVKPKKPIGKSDKGSLLGSGRQGSAYGFENRPNSIIKFVKSTDRLGKGYQFDDHINFINMVVKHQDNPFFPKIYNAKIYDQSEHNMPDVLVVQMEKLHHLTAKKLEDVASHVLASLGFEKINKSARTPDTNYDEHDNDKAGEINHSWEYALHKTLAHKDEREQLIDRTKNPKLKEALIYLEPLFQKFGSDITEKNIMFRLTSSGPHLVFSDPV